MISAAQVALHYGGKFEDAMDMGRAQREFMLAVALAEEERRMERFERVLGVTWDMQSLIGITLPGAGKKTTDGKLPSRVSIPALMALAPEVLKDISNTYRRKYMPVVSAANDVPKGNTLVEVGNLSPADARAFFKRMALGATPPPAEGTE